MGLWNIFAWEGCICMREPYGSLVEFIPSYNCGGGFGGIDGRGLESPHGITVRPAKQWYEVRVEADKDRELLGNF